MLINRLYTGLFAQHVKGTNECIHRMIEMNVPARLQPDIIEATCRGRRFRALLVMAAYESAGHTDWRDVVPLGCAVELLHKASLVHDDLVDQDTMRRGTPAFWSSTDCSKAVIGGDLLISLSFRTLRSWTGVCHTDLFDDICSALHGALYDMAVGELLDLDYERAENVTPQLIEEMCYLKSGSLIAASLRIGALASRADAAVVDGFTDFGKYLGTAFQMVNDINNLDGTDRHSKGSCGHDFARGKKTLATLALMDAGVGLGDLDRLTKDQLTRILTPATEALNRTLAEAKRCLRQLPDGNVKNLFRSLVSQARDSWFWVDTDG